MRKKNMQKGKCEENRKIRWKQLHVLNKNSQSRQGLFRPFEQKLKRKKYLVTRQAAEMAGLRWAPEIGRKM
jgi:hypothetical protein